MASALKSAARDSERPRAGTTSAPPANFDRLARPYWWMEALSFGPWLARARFAFLSDFAHARSALLIGDGDGRFTARLVAACPELHVTAVDASAAMLRALLRRAGASASRVTAAPADARAWPPVGIMPPGAPYDMVATHFFLDCLTTAEVHQLALRLRPLLASGSTWVLSDFAIPPGAYGRFVARPLVAFLYRAFAALTGLHVRKLPDHGSALTRAGLCRIRRRTFLGGLLIAEMWIAQPSPEPKTVNSDRPTT